MAKKKTWFKLCSFVTDSTTGKIIHRDMTIISPTCDEARKRAKRKFLIDKGITTLSKCKEILNFYYFATIPFGVCGVDENNNEIK